MLQHDSHSELANHTKGVILGFLKQRKKDSFARIVLGGGPLSGKSTTAIKLSHSELFGPLVYIDVEGSARFYESELGPGSEYVDMQDLIEGKDIVQQLSKLADKGDGTFPYKTVVIDTWYSLFKRFTKTYDEKAEGRKQLRDETDLYNVKRKTMQTWGDIKSPFTRMLLDILYLPANILWLTWQQQEMLPNGAPKVGSYFPRYDGFTEHMSDVILRITDNYKLQVFRDRSKSLKNGDPLSVASMEKILKVLKQQPAPSEKPIAGAAAPVAPVTPPVVPYAGKVCANCNTPVSAAIAKATASQAGGAILCLKCLKAS